MPRPIFPGSTYLITRRTSQRRFLLKPSKKGQRKNSKVRNIVGYCAAVAAKRTGVVVHALTVLSNHYHMIATDPKAQLPQFLQYFNRLVATCLNASLGRWENFWASTQPSCVRLEGDEDVLDKILYTLANPVSSFLVESAKSWPGLWTSPAAVATGETMTFARPDVYFRKEGKMPETASLEIVRPNISPSLNDEDFADLLRNALKKRETMHQEEAVEKGIKFLGRKAILDQSPFDYPRSREPRRRMSPRIAAKCKWRRLEAIRRLKDFISEYREVWKQWRAGDKSVVFPYGTYALRRFAGVGCAPPT